VHASLIREKKRVSSDRKKSVAKVKKSAPKKDARDSVLLKTMKQDTVNDDVIEGMVKDESLVYELQNQEMIDNPEMTKCFKCDGTGKVWRRQRTIESGQLELCGEDPQLEL